jgi:signal transduction histidine kinase
MSRKLNGLSQRYAAALRQHLKHGPRGSLRPAQDLGRRAMSLGLETLDLARMHEQALMSLMLPGDPPRTRDAMVRRAGTFFAVALTPIEETHRTAREANLRLNHVVVTLSRRSADLAASNRALKQQIVQRRAAEAALRKSARHYAELLAQSRRLQEQLRHLSHQLLSAQEEERKRISRELHDEIAQTLASINVRLGALKEGAATSTKDLQKKIASTQRLVEKSVDIVHRFARELRPTVLDDLGLIPALNSFARALAKRTHLHIHLKIFAAVEDLDNVKRTVLFRVAQEALTNVVRHAQASRVELSIQRHSGTVCMNIKDDGRSFQVQRVLHARRNHRLGLLGMRERVEMIGGRFGIESAPGRGTTIRAEIPLARRGAGGGAESPLMSFVEPRP